MPSVRLEFDDGGLGDALKELANIKPEIVMKRTVNEIAEDLRATTPRDTGELIGSIRQSVKGGEGEIGYTGEYAPHVEYGHRQNVGQFVPKLGKRLKAPFVEGQHFFATEIKAARAVLKKRCGEYLRSKGL